LEPHLSEKKDIWFMKSKFYFQIIIILGLLFSSSCQPKNRDRDLSLNITVPLTPEISIIDPSLSSTPRSTPITTPTEKIKNTTVPTPVITRTSQSSSKTTPASPIITPTDQFQWTDDSRDGYLSKIPIKNLENESAEEIVKTLLVQWFEHYLNDCEVEEYSLRGYEINNIKIVNAPWMRNYEIIANVVYTEKPAVRNEAMKDLSDEEFNSLSFKVLTTFGVLIDGDNYRLRLMPGYGT
jgi:hypothetical protein